MILISRRKFEIFRIGVPLKKLLFASTFSTQIQCNICRLKSQSFTNKLKVWHANWKLLTMTEKKKLFILLYFTYKIHWLMKREKQWKNAKNGSKIIFSWWEIKMNKKQEIRVGKKLQEMPKKNAIDEINRKYLIIQKIKNKLGQVKKNENYWKSVWTNNKYGLDTKCSHYLRLTVRFDVVMIHTNFERRKAVCGEHNILL